MHSSSRRLLLAALALAFLACVARAEARSGFTPSADMARVYVESGNRFGVAPRLLAAVGYNESRHGRSRLPGVSDGINRRRLLRGPGAALRRAQLRPRLAALPRRR